MPINPGGGRGAGPSDGGSFHVGGMAALFQEQPRAEYDEEAARSRGRRHGGRLHRCYFLVPPPRGRVCLPVPGGLAVSASSPARLPSERARDRSWDDAETLPGRVAGRVPAGARPPCVLDTPRREPCPGGQPRGAQWPRGVSALLSSESGPWAGLQARQVSCGVRQASARLRPSVKTPRIAHEPAPGYFRCLSVPRRAGGLGVLRTGRRGALGS